MPREKTIAFVTDDTAYSDEVIPIFLSDSRFKMYYPEPYFSTDENNYGTSYFEELWRSKGKSIRYHRFIRK